jgi:dTDP-glucose 4,6-dehydratase/UDP-glucose 4-epimerase
MKILIIGAKGFIGYNLVRYFSSLSQEVYKCDIIKDNSLSNYIMINPDLPDYETVFINNKYDICINCSGAASVNASFDNTIYDFELNTLNVIKILDSIRKYNNNCKFINLSSAAVYGNPIHLPISETSELSPISPYGYHKLIAENILDEYYRIWKIQTCSVRIFSAYGNGLKKQLIYDVSRKILLDNEIHLFGTGKESRDFIYIDDICQAVNCIIKKDDFKSSKINIANGESVCINKIIHIFKENWQFNKKIIYDGIQREGDPFEWTADISKIKTYGYKQSVSIQEGIKRYIEWIKEEKKLE